MPRATPLTPARPLAVLVATILVAVAAVLSIGAAPADAAKPCWKRALDDWVDNGRVEGTYSSACLQAAIDHLPEDLRMYSDAEERIRDSIQQATRSTQGVSGARGTGSPNADPKAAPVGESEPKVARGSGPIPRALNADTTSADSIPLPLIVLAGLALILMAAGGAGFAHRRLAARRVRSD